MKIKSPLFHYLVNRIAFFYMGTIAVPCYNFTNVVGVLRAGGDVKAGLILDTGCLWVIAIPLTAIAGLVFKLDPLYVFLCVISEDLVKAGLGEMRFRQKKWINNITKEIA